MSFHWILQFTYTWESSVRGLEDLSSQNRDRIPKPILYFENIIKDYYQNYYPKNTRNYITEVNSLRLRSVSLSYDFPKKWLQRVGFVKRASVSVAATNLLLFTNYDGDPEVAAAGAGVGGSSSVGFDYCGVPATSGMSFGLNLTF